MNNIVKQSSKWELYDALIEGVPKGIAIKDCCLGLNWAYVLAESGCGISHVVSGGGRETYHADPHTRDLRSLCELVKSWNFPEATLGVAALNAWYSQCGKIQAFGGTIDDVTPTGSASNPFDSMKERYVGKRVCVVGHFPNVDDMFSTAQVTVLERNCMSSLDTPDSACEYILPEQDLIFMTGTTLTNKTMPRLLELAQGIETVVVGPSALPTTLMRDVGVNIVTGSVAVDPDVAAWAVRSNTKRLWREGIKKFFLEW